MLKIILGTGNDNKVRELQLLLGDAVVVSKSDAQPGVDEYGSSCAANAIVKARDYYKAQSSQDFDYVIADDSGIFVPYLGDNIPGVKSARFSNFEIKNRKLVLRADKSENTDVDLANNLQLLEYLKGKPAEARRAYFYSGIALLDDKGEFVDLFEGITFGTIGKSIEDENGWGYDHVFIAESGNHWGKVPDTIKNAESHRYKASLLLKEYLCP